MVLITMLKQRQIYRIDLSSAEATLANGFLNIRGAQRGSTIVCVL
jgi:hypothetical protein